MKAHSFRSTIARSKRIFLHIVSATAIAALFFFLVLPQKAFADYSNYLKLFSGLSPSPDATLTVPSTIRRSYTDPTAALFDFKFNFQAAFPVSANKDADWHWQHIDKNKPNSFILRICDLDATSGAILKNTCIYTPVPSAKFVDNADTRVTGEPMCKQVNGATACTLPVGNEAWPKIYNYNAQITKAIVSTGGNGMGVGSTDSVTDNDSIVPATSFALRYQFNVIFGSNTFKNLSDGSAVDTTNKFKIGNATKYKADIWYCGDNGGGDQISDATTATYSQGDIVNTFNNLCGNNHPYFKITESAAFQMPATLASAIAQTGAIDTTGGATTSTNQKEPPSSTLPHCGPLNGALGTSGSFIGCFAWLAYYVIYTPVKWFAGLLGMLFDFFLGYSLNDASYRADFAVRGWQIVRDVSNIFFILILVWTGLSAVFNTGVNMKKVVSGLILNAIFINFSLFGTRVIIDISNVVARVFYKSVHVCEGPCEKNADGTFKNLKTGPGGVTPLSEKIIGSFNPQKIFSTAILNGDNATKNNVGGGVNGTVIKTDANGDVIAPKDTEDDPLDRNDYATYFIIVSLIATAILVAVAMMFWKTAFFFLGRVIGLYVAMIFAPFAVLTRGNMPLVGNIKELRWESWFKDLTNYAMLAPIFVFFLYVIYSFLDTDFLKISFGDLNNANFMTIVISITVPMLIVYFMIQQGVNLAKTYAGKIGEMVQSGAMKVLGAGAGIAMGGTAFLGRNAIGRGLSLIGNSGKQTTIGEDGKEISTTRAERWAANANNSWLTRKWNNTYGATQTGSWDARNVGVKIGGKDYKAGSTLFSGLGLSDKVSGVVGLGENKALGKDGKPGGNIMIDKKRAEDKQKELENRIQMTHLSDDQAKNAAALYKNKKIKEAENDWKEYANSADEVKPHADAAKAAAEAVKTAEKEFEKSKQQGTTYEQNVAQIKLADTKTKQIEAEEKLKKERDLFIKNIEETEDKELRELKKAKAVTAAREAEEKRLKDYKITDNKSFTAMMRAEYVENLGKGSFWTDTIGSALGKTIIGTIIGTLIPPLAPAIGAVLGGVFAKELTDDIVDRATGSRAKAIKAILKKAKTKPGTGNALVDMEERIQRHKDTALKAINEALGKNYGSYDEIKSEAEISEGILTRTAHLEEQKDKIVQELKTASGADRTKLFTDRAKVDRELNNLRDIEDKISRARKDIDDYKEKQKDKDDKKAADEKKKAEGVK